MFLKIQMVTSTEFESVNAAVKGQCVKPLHQLAKMVDLDGLEPSTSRLSGVRSNHLSYKPMFLIHSRESLKRIGIRFSQTCGGDKRDRTADPLLAKQVLSQLSYTPISRVENP